MVTLRQNNVMPGANAQRAALGVKHRQAGWRKWAVRPRVEVES